MPIWWYFNFSHRCLFLRSFGVIIINFWFLFPDDMGTFYWFIFIFLYFVGNFFFITLFIFFIPPFRPKPSALVRGSLCYVYLFSWSHSNFWQPLLWNFLWIWIRHIGVYPEFGARVNLGESLWGFGRGFMVHVWFI